MLRFEVMAEPILYTM